ncbi:MAG: HI0074 family nucleotidyltransferase substrate-binding subunit [Lysobacterales bacterium]
MTLDLSSLSKAIAQMEEALVYCESDLARGDARLARHLRAAAIQAFEFTYELTFKMLKRYLEATEPNPASVDEMSFNDIIRRGNELGLLQAELASWKAFRKDRGTTSHAYDEAKAKDVFASIPGFLSEAKFVLNEIRRRQGE